MRWFGVKQLQAHIRHVKGFQSSCCKQTASLNLLHFKNNYYIQLLKILNIAAFGEYKNMFFLTKKNYSSLISVNAVWLLKLPT